MNKYCMNCAFYQKASDINGVCFIIGGMIDRDVLILDKTDIIDKVRKPYQAVYKPVIVQNLFGCVYYKQK
jgi:hypothetical protein